MDQLDAEFNEKYRGRIDYRNQQRTKKDIREVIEHAWEKIGKTFVGNNHTFIEELPEFHKTINIHNHNQYYTASNVDNIGTMNVL